jgi:glycosyltransferase involved in cell wall biosynthesis
MNISIAMTTYNGEKYLEEQLGSIAGQTRPPDQLVVFDDLSSDSTLSILKKFKNRVEFDVCIHQNINNIGYSKNFEKAVLNCTGDIILFCDQDDVWYPNKLETIENFFCSNSGALLVMHDAELFFNNCELANNTLINQTKSLGMQVSRDFGLGCCMAFRKELVDIAYPMPPGVFLHDVWLNKIALLLNGKFFITQVLMKYRRHAQNTTSWVACNVSAFRFFTFFWTWWKKSTVEAMYLRRLELLEIERAMSIKMHDNSIDSNIKKRLSVAIKEIYRELLAIQARFLVVKTPFYKRCPLIRVFYKRGYYSYFSGPKSCFKDLFQK